MTESTSSEPAQAGAAAAGASSAYAPSSVPTFGTPAVPAPSAVPASSAVPAPSAPVAPAPAQPTAADRANQMVEHAGEVISETADKAHEMIGEAADKAGAAIGAAAEKAGEALSDAAHHAATRIRNNAELPAARGRTTIANEVVEKIAGIAAREVPGVYDLGGDVARLFSSIKERLNLGEESRAQGVAVRLEGASAEITVTIVVEFGFVVASVTDTVREKVISSVEALLQLDVKSVDVVVDDIHVDEEGPIGNDKERAHGYSSQTEAIVVGQ